MVEINSGYSGLNTPVIDGYLRSIDEYRKAVENSILPVISHFVARGESGAAVVLLPARLFEDQRPYLERLGRRYFKREFDFRIEPDEPIAAYDSLSTAIRHARKSYQYAALDLCDFMLGSPGQFEGVRIPLNLARGALEEIAEYNHIVPPALEAAAAAGSLPEPASPAGLKAPALHARSKFREGFSLYAAVLSNVKRAVDFEALKLYDFLLENPGKNVESNKLLSTIDEIERLAQEEYTKLPHMVKIAPKPSQGLPGEWNPWIDEWAANVLRGLEHKQLLASDLSNYLSGPQGTQHVAQVEAGCYPELSALLGNHTNYR